MHQISPAQSTSVFPFRWSIYFSNYLNIYIAIIVDVRYKVDRQSLSASRAWCEVSTGVP